MKKQLLPAIIFAGAYITGNLAISLFLKGITIELLLDFLFYAINTAFAFLISRVVLTTLVKRNALVTGVAFVLASFLFYAIVHYLNEQYVEVLITGKGKAVTPFWRFAFFVIPHYIIVSGFALAFFYYTNAAQKEITIERQKTELAEATAKQMEADAHAQKVTNEVLSLKLRQLRTQLNPHFLRNVLISIDSDITEDHAAASAQIVKLADLMDYLLKEPSDDDTELLRDEVHAITLLLSLMQEQHISSYAVTFTIEGTIGNHRIVANILLTLVENLMKFGYINKPEMPATIILKVESDTLQFSTFNWKRHFVSPYQKGMGTKNITRMLAIAYPDKHRFEIQETDTTYTTTLTLLLS